MPRLTSRGCPGRQLVLAVATVLAAAGVLLVWPGPAPPTSQGTQRTPAVPPATPTRSPPSAAHAPTPARTSPTASATSSPSATRAGSAAADQDLAEPDGDPVLGGIPATVPADAGQHAASAAATAFLHAFARPTDDAPGWWDRVRPLLTPQAALDYAGTDPARVPFTRITGPGLIQPVVDEEAHLVTFVRIPTDAGVYLVHLQHDGIDWLVSRVTPPAEAGNQ
jgi:hypothetical protein